VEVNLPLEMLSWPRIARAPTALAGRRTRRNGAPGMTHPFELTISRSDGAGNVYLEAAAGVAAFILAGRYFEARSKRKAGAVLKALLKLGAKEVTVLREGREHLIATAGLQVGDRFLVRPGEKIATDGNGAGLAAAFTAAVAVPLN
jgi:P-type Cu+ transporter